MNESELAYLWANPAERQLRHLELRQRHTTFLTDRAESTEVWAVARILAHLQQSADYWEQPGLLDAGCGPGRYLELMLDPTSLTIGRLVGLDRSRAALETAQSRLGQRAEVSFVQGNLRQLPFAQVSFGAIMCNRMLNQTGAIGEALAQAATVLRPGGFIFIVTADSLESSPLTSSHETALQKLGFPAPFYWHSTRSDQRFHLQNGVEWLAPHFGDISSELYERHLTFDDPAELGEYYATGLLFWRSEPAITIKQWLALYNSVVAELESKLHTNNGRLSWQDGAALFRATRAVL